MTTHRRSRDLKRDTRGNTLMLFGFALFPMLGMIGSALDISRAYLVKSRLQQACDAGALAGRRSMTTADFNTDPAAKPTAERFFNLNFTPGRYGSFPTTGASTVSYTAGTDMIVHGTANMSVPTVLMRIFGKDTVDLTVTCDAQLQLPNSDIMFVLDTTSSMAETPSGESQSKIVSLRSAVDKFYDTLTDSTPPGSTIRYGFVPYSSTVNVGMLLQRDWMADDWKYQSRQPIGEPEAVNSAPAADRYWDTSQPYAKVSGDKTSTSKVIPFEDCAAPKNAYTVKDDYTTPVNEVQSNGDLWRRRIHTQTLNGHVYSINQDATNQICTLVDVFYDKYVQQREKLKSRTLTQAR